MITGDLTEHSLPGIFRQIYTERKSGELLITSASQRKSVYFENGNIVFAASDATEDRLGEVLVRHGVIEKEVLQNILQNTSHTRLGNSLIHHGVLTERDIKQGVAFQILETVYSVFSWSNGGFQFYDGLDRVPQDVKLQLTTANVILEGVRRIKKTEIIRRGLGNLNLHISPSFSALLRMQTVTLKPVDTAILNLVTQPTEILGLFIELSPLFLLADIAKSIYGLVSAGILDQTEPVLADNSEVIVKPEGEIVLTDIDRNLIIPSRDSSSLIDLSVGYEIFSDLIELEKKLKEGHIWNILNLNPDTLNDDTGYYAIRKQSFLVMGKFHPDRFILFPLEIQNRVWVAFLEVQNQVNSLIEILEKQSESSRFKKVVKSSFPPPYIPREKIANLNLSDTSESVESEWPGPEKRAIYLDDVIYTFYQYLNGLIAPLFAQQALDLLLRTTPPFRISTERLAELIIDWARQHTGYQKENLSDFILRALRCIRNAEMCGVLSEFSPAIFYPQLLKEFEKYFEGMSLIQFKNQYQSFLNYPG